MTTKEYLLVCLIEECSEVIKDATKALRFGLDDVDPNNNPTSLSNEEKIMEELEDIDVVKTLLLNRNIIKELPSNKQVIDEKLAKKIKWMKYSRERGIITD